MAELLNGQRVEEICANQETLRPLLQRIGRVALDGLRPPYNPKTRMFAFSRKLAPGLDVSSDGESLRYTAIALLGASWLPEPEKAQLFSGSTPEDACSALIQGRQPIANVGDLALLTWCAARLKLVETGTLASRLEAAVSQGRACLTVEAAWALSALVAAFRQGAVERRSVEATFRTVFSAYRDASQLFAHWTDHGKAPFYRAHVACFADQVYPIQALARYYHAFRDPEAFDAASGCARQICDLQGAGGQWWWHYDVRSGRVVEGYPVYSVHQDSMAPMALFDLSEAGGRETKENIRRGLLWVESAPEIGQCLIDDERLVIWRKVARGGPSKMVRSLRALLTLMKRDWRASWLDRLLPPTRVDWECRPYHLGWILMAWLGRIED